MAADPRVRREFTPQYVAWCLAIAMAGAPLIRSATAELNRSAGIAWPFSLAHCRAADTPGCGPEPVVLTRLATR